MNNRYWRRPSYGRRSYGYRAAPRPRRGRFMGYRTSAYNRGRTYRSRRAPSRYYVGGRRY
jgi:hypothetical protein